MKHPASEFVRDVVHSEQDRSVVSAIVSLAEGFGLETIAEGVEDEQTAGVLQSLGVGFAQGYWFGRPGPLIGGAALPPRTERASLAIRQATHSWGDDVRRCVPWEPMTPISASESSPVRPRAEGRERPVRPLPTIERAEVSLHGQRVSFTIAGQGPPVVLIHGVAGRAAQWDQIVRLLADTHTVLAPDLLGHGESAKPRGDYSLGAHASGIRDLLVGLSIDRASIVGHSLGGGIAMQFAYQFPERCERLVLVSSGGLGQEVHPLLRAATLPGSDFVLPLLAHPRVLQVASLLPRALARIGLLTRPDLTEMARGYQSLSNAEARSAFIDTLRGVIDPAGQRINATDRLYLASKMPSLIIWGRLDRIIPVEHAQPAHKGMPGSRLELFETAGHFPQLDDPLRFARTLEDFLDETEPAKLDTDMMRELVLGRDPKSAAVLARLQRQHPVRPKASRPAG